jgi:hypothetical protein
MSHLTLVKQSNEYVKQAYTTTGRPDKVTDRYRHIDSVGIYKAIESLGFSQLTGSAKRGGDYTRHITTFQRQMPVATDETLYPRVIVDNSHDGSRACYIRFGIYRMVCSNGLIIGSDFVKPLRIVHTGKPIDDLPERIQRWVIAAESAFMGLYSALINKTIKLDSLQAFLKEAAELRYGDKEVDLRGLLRVRRYQDSKDTAWHLYNVVQENLLQGGLLRRSRAVTSDSKKVDLNDALFNLVMKYAA